MRSRNRRRAENQVWTAAGDYDFAPAFLAFHADGTPDAYLNAIVGFTHRFYDAAALRDYLASLGSSLLVDTFTDLCWLALESAVYPQAVRCSPALPQLREAHARRYLCDLRAVDISLQQRMLQAGVVQTLKTARCREVLGEPLRLYHPWDRRLYAALSLPPERDTAALIRRMDEVLRRYFVFRWTNHLRQAMHIALPAWLHAVLRRLLPVRRVQDDTPRRTGGSGTDVGTAGAEGQRGLRLRAGGDWRRVLASFGAPYFPEGQRARFEEEICVGAHQRTHIFYARAGAGQAARALNTSFYQAHRAVYRTAARKLAAQVRNTLAVWRQPLLVPARTGRFTSAWAWRGACELDGRLFAISEERPRSDFDVTLLLDASASRESQQALIAAQAYTLAEGLMRAGLRVQVWSFASVERVTALTVLKAFGARQADGIFAYEARGWNRDGLALRALRPLLPAGRRQLVLCLTDAHPGDAFGLLPEGRTLAQAYMGKAAVRDAAAGCRALRRAGVRIVGLVNSVFPEETTQEAAREIFGTAFLCLRSPQDLALRAGAVIERELRR